MSFYSREAGRAGISGDFNYRAVNAVFLAAAAALCCCETPVSGACAPPVSERIVSYFASREPGCWRAEGKVRAPRVLLAKLAAGEDAPGVNRYLLESEPWSKPGSSFSLAKGLLRRKGDYDFTVVTLTSMLYLFGDDPEKLAPETVEHMLDNLLVLEGGRPMLRVPPFPVRETENHILMAESSRYLKNQWLFHKGGSGRRGNPVYDNSANGLKKWLLNYLRDLFDSGFVEFNSIPYEGYTVQALLNLADFAEPETVSEAAVRILDGLSAKYALGSLNLRRYSPYRRSERHAEETLFTNDRMSAAAGVWLDDPYGTIQAGWPRNLHHMLPAAMSRYSPPGPVREFMLGARFEYYVRLGHGGMHRPERSLPRPRPRFLPNPSALSPRASPEIYSGGEGFLISAGGAYRGKRAGVFPRATTLLVEDGALDARDCFHIPGRGRYNRYPYWNNTGVYRNFAVGPENVRIPEGFSPAAECENWSVFKLGDLLLAAVHNTEGFGLMAVFRRRDYGERELLRELNRRNPEPGNLNRRFVYPGGSALEYDVTAPPGLWVIESVDGEPACRDYDSWSRGFSKPLEVIRAGPEASP